MQLSVVLIYLFSAVLWASGPEIKPQIGGWKDNKSNTVNYSYC